MNTETSEFSFNVSSPAKIKLDNISGSVKIEPGEDGIIHVMAIKHQGHGDTDKTRIECVQTEDGTVSISTKFSDFGWNFLFGSQVCDVEYVVKAPAQCSLIVNGVSNSLNVSGFEGAFKFKTVSGDLRLNSLIGPLKIDSVSGDIQGENLSGSIQLNSVSGDIHLRESKLNSADAKTVSGDVSLQINLSEGPYKFNTVSGDIRLVVPGSTNCQVEMKSVSGDFSTNLPVNQSTYTHGNHLARVGSGGVEVTLKSVSGDLLLEGEGDIPQATEKKTIDILSKVESGEISVEDALSLLNG